MLTPEQIQKRSKGIGASESAIILGKSTYSTPYKLWLEKTGRFEKKQKEEDHQWWGHAMEPVIASRYEFETGEKLEYKPETIIHPKIPYMLCHPDRYVIGKRKLVEIKKIRRYDEELWGEPGTDQIPDEYVIQVQHQLACTGYEENDLMAFFTSYEKSQRYPFKRDEKIIETIEKAVCNFWNNHVLADIAPPLTETSDYKLKFKRNSDNYVEATPEVIQLISVLKQVRQRQKEEEVIEKNCLMGIYGFIQDALGIKQENKVLATWKFDKNGKRTFRLSEK